MKDSQFFHNEEILSVLKDIRKMGGVDPSTKLLEHIETLKGEKGETGTHITKITTKNTDKDVTVTLSFNDKPDSSFKIDRIAGKDGEPGAKGYTPVKGKDYFDGVDGKDGKDGIRGIDGLQGKSGTNGKDGKSITWRGSWDINTSYKPQDAVEYGGSSYIAIREVTRINPDTSDSWNLMAQKGKDGMSRGSSTSQSSGGSGDMLKSIYDPSSKNTQFAADTEVIHNTGDTIYGTLAIANSNSAQSLQLTPTGDAGNSSSVGGAVNINNTSNPGSGLVVYTNNTTGTGHLTQIRSNQDSFTQNAMFIDYRGQTNALNIVRRSPTSGTVSAAAWNMSSLNENGSAVQIRGTEKALGSVKITHENPSTTDGTYDANAAALSIDIVQNTATGAGTSAAGVYINSTTGTLGKLLRVRHLNTDIFTVDATTISANSNRIQAVGDPSSAQDAATKNYVDLATPVYNFVPSNQNLLSWSYDPVFAANSTVLTTAGTVYLVKVHLPTAVNITNIVMQVVTAGATLTSGQCFAGIYKNGTLLGSTADQSTSWNSTGTKTMAISGGSIAVSAGDVYVAFYYNGTTAPAFARSANTSAINAGLAASAARYASADTARTTSLPSTLGTMTALSISYWVGLS